MARRKRLAAIAIALAAILTLVVGPASAGGPGKWTKLSLTSQKADGFDQPSAVRTADGKLHVVYEIKPTATLHNIRWVTLSQAGKTLASGNVLPSNWVAIDPELVLLPDGSGGLRVVFIGNQDTNGANFFARGPIYTATSPNGQTWTLQTVTLGQHTVLNGDFGAAAELNGTPVAAFGLNATTWFHEGTDATAPATGPDGSIAQASTIDNEGEALATNSDGSVWLGWWRWTDAATQGYYVEKILPSQGSPLKAPNSGNKDQLNSPTQRVALAARKGGGVYMAYCSPTKTKPCAHVSLWKVGAGKAATVPGTTSGNARLVTLVAGNAGRLWVLWWDSVKSRIDAVRTGTNGSGFGSVVSIKPPPKWALFERLSAEGSSGRVDVLANIVSGAAGNPVEIWHTQLLPGLKLTAKPSSFGHGSSATVTFTVTDAGQAVAGAKVSCLGKKGTTNAKGVVKLHFGKGEATGKHVAAATKGGYNGAKVTVKVT